MVLSVALTRAKLVENTNRSTISTVRPYPSDNHYSLYENYSVARYLRNRLPAIVRQHSSDLETLHTSNRQPLLHIRVGGHGVAAGLDLGVGGQGGGDTLRVAHGVLAPVGGVLLALFGSQVLREGVVQQHVRQGQLVADGESVVAQGGLDAAHPPLEETGRSVRTHSWARYIGGTSVKPLVVHLLGWLGAIGDDGTVSGVQLLQMLVDGDDLGSLQVVASQKTILGSEVVVDGGGLTNALVANLSNRHSAQVGIQAIGGSVVATVGVCFTLFNKMKQENPSIQNSR